MANSKAILFSASGLIGLLASSKLLVWGAVNIAVIFGVSDLVIGLTIVAIGTSLPELASSIASVLKKEHDLAVGNIIGSNAFNLLAVFCLPGLIQPGPIESNLASRDFPVMLGLTVLLLLFSYSFTGQPKIGRFKGFLFLILFIAYLGKLYLDSVGT